MYFLFLSLSIAFSCLLWNTDALHGLGQTPENSLSRIDIKNTTSLIFFSPFQNTGLFMGEGLGMQSPAHHSDHSCPSAKAGVSGEPGEELDLSFLPDDFSTPVHNAGLPSSL